jgi:hypothetical protein
VAAGKRLLLAFEPEPKQSMPQRKVIIAFLKSLCCDL